ncbi:hypothetical protein CK203_034376 [Vitis vinifera]|uniref:Uncharacterized protein n=1 Tax=Vitis vinifera TaxID=29760 RepID=A0A438HZF9_VITVI|nr:hypothetical protein CK203_034376 [Vitis vinifera]
MDLFPTSCFLKNLFGSTRVKYASSCTTGCPDKWSKHAPPKLKLDKSSSSYLWERALSPSSAMMIVLRAVRQSSQLRAAVVLAVILSLAFGGLPLTKELSLLTLISPFASSFSVASRIDSGILSYHRHAGRTGAIFLLSIGTAKQRMGWVTDSNNCVIPCRFPRDPNLLSMSTTKLYPLKTIPQSDILQQRAICYKALSTPPVFLQTIPSLYPDPSSPSPSNVIRVLMGCSVLNMLFQLDLSLLEILFVYTMKMGKKGSKDRRGHLMEWVEKASFTWLNKLFEIDVSE